MDRGGEAIAAPPLVMTDRAGRWVTRHVGQRARTINGIAMELGCDWHPVNDAVIAYGTALVDDDPTRFGQVTALGLDETLFARLGPWRTQAWSTQLVDVRRSQLLDVIPGRNAAGPCAWLAGQGNEWCSRIEFGPWIFRGRIGRCSTRCYPTRPRSRIPATW
jgi:hypothetical protein